MGGTPDGVRTCRIKSNVVVVSCLGVFAPCGCGPCCRHFRGTCCSYLEAEVSREQKWLGCISRCFLRPTGWGEKGLSEPKRGGEQKWRTQEFCWGGGVSTNSVEGRGQRERGSGGGSPLAP
jgi:hypothetical protein